MNIHDYIKTLGYDDNSPINHVEKLKGEYLLIHGSADDNVHVQNTYEMTSALVRANKQFDLFVYPCLLYTSPSPRD